MHLIEERQVSERSKQLAPENRLKIDPLFGVVVESYIEGIAPTISNDRTR